jgi:hypothetical protein
MRFYRLIGSVTRNGETLPWISLGMFTNEASAQRAADWTAGLTGLPPGTEWQPWPDGRVARSWSSDDMRVSQVIAPFDTGTPASKPTRASMPPSVPSVTPSAPTRKDGKRLYIVQSGRSSTLHLMLSKSPSTPDPMSPGSVALQLVFWSGVSGKTTLCGRPAARAVSDVFQPNEVTCRECKRRAGFG